MSNILHTIASLNVNGGGPPRTVTGLCAALSRLQGIDLKLSTQALAGEEQYLGDMHTKQVETAFFMNRFSRLFSIGYGTHLAKVADSFSAEIVHDHGIWLPSNIHAFNLAHKLDRLYVVHPRGMLEPWSLSFRQSKKRLAWWAYQRRMLQGADAFIATSQMEAESIVNLGFSSPVAMIPNGISFRPGTVGVVKNSEEYTALFVSRIHEKKGVLDLIEAWAKLRPANWRLVIAGPDDGGYLHKVMSSIERHRLFDCCEYVGVVEGEQKAELFEKADLFVLPSYSENFGVVVAEALASQTPVITTKATPWSAVEDYGCGWSVGTGVDSIYKALEEATSLNRATLKAMGSSGLDLASKFNWDRIALDTSRVYSWLSQGGSKPECVIS